MIYIPRTKAYSFAKSGIVNPVVYVALELECRELNILSK